MGYLVLRFRKKRDICHAVLLIIALGIPKKKKICVYRVDHSLDSFFRCPEKKDLRISALITPTNINSKTVQCSNYWQYCYGSSSAQILFIWWELPTKLSKRTISLEFGTFYSCSLSQEGSLAHVSTPLLHSQFTIQKS